MEKETNILRRISEKLYISILQTLTTYLPTNQTATRAKHTATTVGMWKLKYTHIVVQINKYYLR